MIWCLMSAKRKAKGFFEGVKQKFLPAKKEKRGSEVKKDLLSLRKKVLQPEEKTPERIWEERIEAIFQMQRLGKELSALEEGRAKSALLKEYTLWDKEVFGLKGAKKVRDLLLSKEEPDCTRVLHLLEEKIGSVRSIVEVAKSIQDAHESTESFIKQFKGQKVLDRLEQLTALREYQLEQIEEAKKKSLKSEDQEEAASYIQTLQNRKQITDEQLEKIYTQIERSYLPFYEMGLKALKSFSEEETEEFLVYIKRKNSKKLDDFAAMGVITSVLARRLQGEDFTPENLNIDLLRVASNLLRGFLRKEIERSFLLRQAA